MMLEKIITDVLNRFLGDYIENLDRKQLSIGVWGGDVVLRNLIIKQSSLDDLNLPLQTVFGCIDKLTLKVPWKDPFNLPIEASADQFFLLAKPNTEVKYDPVKEGKENLYAKQSELKRVDLAKIKEQEKDKPKDFSFVEKLCSQFIKNTQIYIKNLHVRYEDNETRPGHPFSAGLTLGSLVIVTTDNKWVPGIVHDISKIFKILQLEALAFYLNCGSPSYISLTKEEMLLRFQAEIATKNTQPEECQYILCPINASVYLTITQKPELEKPVFSSPKFDIKLDMQKLGISISKLQYRNIIAFCDSMSYMTRGLPYRKYRPCIPYANNYKEWWQFAYVCVLERDVQRRKLNWNWQHMLEHREKCKTYASLYETKLQTKKPSSDILQKLDKLEADLDLVNLVIIRRKVELEVERAGPPDVESSIWTLNWWWSGTKPKQGLTEPTEILRDFEAAMSPDEKKRLYKAIDYQENSAQVEYPEEYVDKTFKFILHMFEIDIKDDELRNPLVLTTKLSSVQCKIDLRPAVSAMKVHINVDQLSVDGYAQDMEIPKLISGVADETGLLSILYETNPIDKKCGERIQVYSKPLKIIYDALTVINATNIFKITESTAMEQLALATSNSINNVKQMTATGLQYAIGKHTSLEIDIDLRAPYIIMPYGGKYTGNENALVINLGRMRVSTESRPDSTIDLRALHASGTKDDVILTQLIDQSYDKFKIHFTDLEIVLAQSGENWEECIGLSKVSNLHILNPLTLHVTLHKCLIVDDPRLPLMKVRGKLPSISLTVVNTKLILLIALINSIPFPKSDEYGQEQMLEKSDTVVVQNLKYLNHTVVERRKPLPVPEKIVQFTNMDIHFVWDELLIILMDQEYSYSTCVKVSSFTAHSLEIEVIQQTYNMSARVKLKSIGMSQFIPEEVHLIHANKYRTEDQYLINVRFVQVDRKSPEFDSKYLSCESFLSVHFATLDITLHLEALQSIMRFTNDLQAQIEEVREASLQQSDRFSNRSLQLKRTISTLSEGFVEEAKKKVRRPQNPAFKDIVLFKLNTKLDQFSVKLRNRTNEITSVAIEGINVNVTIKKDSTQIVAILENLIMLDLNDESIYYKIVSVLDDEALNAQVVMYNLDEYSDPESIDMSVKVKVGQMKIVFLHWFVSKIIDFMNEFQTAQQKIIEASQEAAKKAKQNMQDAYKKATRISLNIDIKAPYIVIPANSKSFDAILLVLGHITLRNAFKDMNVINEFNHSAVVDEIILQLTHFKVARIKLNTLNMENIIQKQETLLKPFNFVLYVKHNLSSAWYKDIPDIDVNLKVEDLTLTICQLDYKIIMGVLSGNLAEGRSKDAHSREQIGPMRRPAAAKSTISGITLNTLILDEDLDENVHVFLKFTFTMDKFNINIAFSSLEDGLGLFYLEGLSIKGRMLTNNLLVTSVLLVNCIIEDTRKEREGNLNRLMERKVDSEYTSRSSGSSEMHTVTKSMIDIIYQQNGSNMFVDLKVSSFNLILSMDFLMTLGDFFTKAIPVEGGQLLGVDYTKSNKSIPPNSLSTASMQSQTNMTINLKIEQPDIILVEQMDNIDTNALILNSEIIMKIRNSDSHIVVSGTVKDFELYTCCYNPIKRAASKGQVLHPVNISIAGSTPEGAGLHMEVYISQVKLSVSPATIELLNRCHSTMIGHTVESEKIEKRADYSNLWTHKPFTVDDYWFLKPDLGEEALDFSAGNETFVTPDLPRLKEMCILQMPSIIITIETGSGNKTMPMLFLESSFEVSVNNWSSQMSVEATLKLQMAYYNNRLALWEPLIEPNQIEKDNSITSRPWELKVEVSMGEVEDVSSPDQEVDSVHVNSAAMNIDISSTTTLEMTLTKTSLDVFSSLGKAFASAMQLEQVKKKQFSPYTFINACGLPITLLLSKDHFTLPGSHSTANVILESGAEVNLQLTEKQQIIRKSVVMTGTELDFLNKSEEFYIHVLINDFNCELELPIVRADTRYYSLRGPKKDMGIICEIEVTAGIRIIKLRSILQIRNEFNIPVDVYYMTDNGNELEFISTLEPHKLLNMPFKSVYTNTSEIFFSVNGFSVTRIPYVWKDLQSSLTVTSLLYCESKNRHMCLEPFIIKAVGDIRQVFYENTSRYTMLSTCYYINLRPAVVFKNCLPIDVICLFETTVDQYTAKPGVSIPLPNIDPGKSVLVLRIPSYLEKEWSCTFHVSESPLPFSVWTFQSNDAAAKMRLDLGINAFNKHGSMILSLYCPFWMINKTGFLLAYRKSKKTEKHEARGSPAKNSDEHLNVLHHPASFKGPILFSFNVKNFFGKKKASIRIEQGDWSDRFSLDVAGSSGMVVCNYDEDIYQIGVHNQLTHNGLTKQVTFTPYFIILNNSQLSIECQEADRPADPWTRVETNSCTPLWPKSEQEDKLLKLRITDTNEISPPFLITESHTTLLKLNNPVGGINVDIQMIEGAIYINFTQYDRGMAPALIFNHTKNSLSFWEKETVQIRKLKPNHRLLYTWENPSGPRILVWDIGKNNDMEDELRKDGIGQFVPKGTDPIYWISFLNGMQRVLLFTRDRAVAAEAQSASKFEHIRREITLSIHGLGVSFVNNQTRTEIMYLAIASSGVIWEQCKMSSKRFKQMSTKDSINVENTYQKFLTKRMIEDESAGRFLIDPKTEVDFIAGVMLRPRKRMIRRSFQTGFWIQMKSSPHQMQLHAKINRIQIDNQMFDCLFPVVLAPVPPPKSVALNNAHKPFAELSIVQLLIKNTQIRQFKYFKVLIQEFHIKVDISFINALMEVIQSDEATENEEMERFKKDTDVVNEPLYAHASLQSQQEQKNFYDLLHFSPLKIHVSFTLSTSGGQAASTPNFMNVILQGLGVTLTNLQDVVFKLGYFERNYSFLTQKQLINEASRHYVGQSVKQLYVLVFGLDVIGNPYGLVLGITKGVEDFFYEPIQGAIQGPGEFAEGVVLGVRSLFGHTVGGAAGAVSRITGAMGKGVAALTFDKDFQRKRRDQNNKKPATMQEGFARGGKGLVMGVFDGVTGVFTKPITGAKEQGIGGFFKGLGKGAVGLVARPTAGVIDFTSGSLDAVKRATEMGDEPTRIRPSRFCQADGLVRPYNLREAEGNKMLYELEKGKYATTDIYAYHYIIIEKKDVLMLTDKRLVYITHNDIFGGWQAEWGYTWQDMKTAPTPSLKGVCVSASDIKKKKKGLFMSSDGGKIVLISDPEIQEHVCNKIEELRNKAFSL